MNNDWMTFGEMLDRIKLGQIAEPDVQNYSDVTLTPLGLRYVDRWTRKPWESLVPVTRSYMALRFRFTGETLDSSAGLGT